MLKRFQVLLTDWLAEYAQFVSEEYDVSFSEAVRILMCIGTVYAVREIFPQFKSKMISSSSTTKFCTTIEIGSWQAFRCPFERV
jgi:hypothetical protein